MLFIIILLFPRSHDKPTDFEGLYYRKTLLLHSPWFYTGVSATLQRGRCDLLIPIMRIHNQRNRDVNNYDTIVEIQSCFFSGGSSGVSSDHAVDSLS